MKSTKETTNKARRRFERCSFFLNYEIFAVTLCCHGRQGVRRRYLGKGLRTVEEKALLAFLDAVIGAPEVSDVVFENAMRHFSDQILVEVVTMQVRFSLEHCA